MNSFSVQAMVRGYHVYRDVWAASIGELLPCEREAGNASDRYAVAVMKDFAVVGHVPRKISTIILCSIFLRRGGTIDCHITAWMQEILQGSCARWPRSAMPSDI